MIIKTILTFSLIAYISFYSGCSSDLPNQTPKCSNGAVVNVLTELLTSSSRKATIDIDVIRQIDFDEQNGMRTCQTNVDYVFSVDDNNRFITSFKKAMTGSPDGVSKMNKISYTVVLGETGKKFIVNLKEE